MVAAGAFVVAAVFYSAWIPGQFATPGVDKTHGYLSELAARNQSWSVLFRLTDALAGAACLIGVALVPRVVREWAGWLGMAVFGLFTIGDSVFPLDCAALSDSRCEQGSLSFSHYAHTATSILAVTGALVSMVVLSRLWRSTIAWVITAATLTVTVVALVAVSINGFVGVAQRVQVLLIATWLLYLAIRLATKEVPVAPTGRTHVVREGSGPAVLLASGMGGTCGQWDAVAAGLAADRKVIRFDRPGLGRSPAETTTPTLYGEAARLAALAPDHPQRVTVVAHSVAAWHAEAFARLHPQRIGGLVLVDPSCEPGPRRRTSAAGRALGRWLPALGGTWGLHATARLTGRGGGQLAAGAGEWLAYRDMAADLLEIRREHRLPAVDVVLISAGRRDRCQEALAAELGAKLVRLPRSGHMVQLDHPAAVVEACRFNAE